MKSILAVLLLLCVASGFAADRPNVVFILADDLGWSDTTLYGTTKLYQTPNLERLAKRGMTFSRAYAASPLCSPTRASILTGQTPARTGLTAPNCHLKQVVLKAGVNAKAPPHLPARLCSTVTRFDTRYYSLGKCFKDNGYATAHFGKWHLGPEPYSPLQHGFDVDVPHWQGPGPAGSFVAPWRFPKFKEKYPKEHIEDRMGDEAVAFLEQHRNKPFFLNYWQFSVHAPFDAKQALIDKYRKLIDPKDPQRSATYAAMVQSLDDNVGKILDALDRLNLTDKTIIVFFSDNGGNMYNEIDGTTPTSNTPYRGGKATIYEGGVRVPCVISWPGMTDPGSRSQALIQSTDFYPTFVEQLQLKPKQKLPEFDGVNLEPALRGKAMTRAAIFTYFPHSASVPETLPAAVSVHSQDWKLIRIFHGGADASHGYLLYNLKTDPGESKNLASEHPERVAALDKLIDRFLVESKAVVPLPNPAYDPAAKRPPRPAKKPRPQPKPKK